jgi:hypothetical protein
VFTHEDLFNFINSAPNSMFLVIKLIFLFCYYGALRMSECAAILRNDVYSTPKGLLVKIIRKKTDRANVGTSFLIPNVLEEKYNPVDLLSQDTLFALHLPQSWLIQGYL